jgi:hypothetical protein
MSGSIPNSETTGAAMEWQNFICSILTEHLQNQRKEIRLKLPFRELTTTTQSDGISFELTYPMTAKL